MLESMTNTAFSGVASVSENFLSFMGLSLASRLRRARFCGAVVALLSICLSPVLSAYQEEAIAQRWSIADAVYSGQAADISENTDNARATDFKPDGSRMYIVGRSSRNVAEYALSRPWDVGSAHFVQALTINASAANGLFFNKENGTDMYVFNRRQIQQYKLAVPWDVATAELVKTKDMQCENAELVRGHDIHFRSDGAKFYVEDRNHQEVYQYRLSAPWDVETLEWEYTLDISDQQEAVRGIELNPDGTPMWLMDTGRNQVLEYHLETPWALDSAQFKRSLDLSGTSTNSRGFTWRPDGGTFYITSTQDQKVCEFLVPVADEELEARDRPLGPAQ